MKCRKQLCSIGAEVQLKSRISALFKNDYVALLTINAQLCLSCCTVPPLLTNSVRLFLAAQPITYHTCPRLVALLWSIGELLLLSRWHCSWRACVSHRK